MVLKSVNDISFLRQIKRNDEALILYVGIKYYLHDLLFDVNNFVALILTFSMAGFNTIY